MKISQVYSSPLPKVPHGEPPKGPAFGFAKNDHKGMIDLYNHPDIYDAVITNDSRQDKDFYLAEARQTKQPVLEVTCGTGRITIPLAKQGADITGIDLSEAMLNKAEKNAEEAGVKVKFVRGDAIHFELHRKFGLIIVPASGLLLLNSKDDVNRFLQCANKHLLPGGKLVFDVLAPNSFITNMPPDAKFMVHKYADKQGNKIYLNHQDFHYDQDAKIFRYSMAHVNGKTGEEVRKDTTTFQIYTPEELRAMLYQNGFVISNEYGDYSRNPYSAGASHQIVVCKKL